MPSGFRVFLLLIVLLAGGMTVGAQEKPPISRPDQFATLVADTLHGYLVREHREEVLEKPIHWYFAVDISGSMSGSTGDLVDMLRVFLRYTVVEGDRVTRIRFGLKNIIDGPVDLDVKQGTSHIDPTVTDLSPRDIEGTFTADVARERCISFIQASDPRYARVAVLISDRAENENAGI